MNELGGPMIQLKKDVIHMFTAVRLCCARCCIKYASSYLRCHASCFRFDISYFRAVAVSCSSASESEGLIGAFDFEVLRPTCAHANRRYHFRPTLCVFSLSLFPLRFHRPKNTDANRIWEARKSWSFPQFPGANPPRIGRYGGNFSRPELCKIQ